MTATPLQIVMGQAAGLCAVLNFKKSFNAGPDERMRFILYSDEAKTASAIVSHDTYQWIARQGSAKDSQTQYGMTIELTGGAEPNTILIGQILQVIKTILYYDHVTPSTTTILSDTSSTYQTVNFTSMHDGISYSIDTSMELGYFYLPETLLSWTIASATDTAIPTEIADQLAAVVIYWCCKKTIDFEIDDPDDTLLLGGGHTIDSEYMTVTYVDGIETAQGTEQYIEYDEENAEYYFYTKGLGAEPDYPAIFQKALEASGEVSFFGPPYLDFYEIEKANPPTPSENITVFKRLILKSAGWDNEGTFYGLFKLITVEIEMPPENEQETFIYPEYYYEHLGSRDFSGVAVTTDITIPVTSPKRIIKISYYLGVEDNADSHLIKTETDITEEFSYYPQTVNDAQNDINNTDITAQYLSCIKFYRSVDMQYWIVSINELGTVSRTGEHDGINHGYGGFYPIVAWSYRVELPTWTEGIANSIPDDDSMSMPSIASGTDYIIAFILENASGVYNGTVYRLNDAEELTTIVSLPDIAATGGYVSKNNELSDAEKDVYALVYNTLAGDTSITYIAINKETDVITYPYTI